MRKRIVFYVIMLALPVLVPVGAVMTYYAYQKVMTPSRSEGSYGQIDGELGWVLKPGATSRYRLVDRLSGTTLFDSTVYVDRDGFRAAGTGAPALPADVLAIGDSWTFGYALDYEHGYPAQLERISGRRVLNMGVPAYGSAQVLVLLERHVARLRPSHVVHLNKGLWQRSLCHGASLPRHILKPCFWLDGATGRIELVTPQPGYVARLAAGGVYPGGWLTAGNDTWTYYLVSRPLARIKQLLSASGLMPGHRSEHDADPTLAPLLLEFTLRRLLELAREHGFRLVLLDPSGDYAPAVDATNADDRRRFEYVSAEAWLREVEVPAQDLPGDQRLVPGDGHYAAGMNRLIAAAVARRLAPAEASAEAGREAVTAAVAQ